MGRQVEAEMSEKAQHPRDGRKRPLTETENSVCKGWSWVQGMKERVMAKTFEVRSIDTGSRSVPLKNNPEDIVRRW